MQYVANPVKVKAYRITHVHQPSYGAERAAGTELIPVDLTLENGWRVTASPEMQSRLVPKAGDYWVIQEDGYVYLNPAAVFLRKYSPVAPA
jgi:hypothetical protein